MARLNRIKTNQTAIHKPASKMSTVVVILTVLTLLANLAVLAKIIH